MTATRRIAAFARFLILMIALIALSGCIQQPQPQPQPQPTRHRREPVRDYDYSHNEPIAVEESGSAPPPGPMAW